MKYSYLLLLLVLFGCGEPSKFINSKLSLPDAKKSFKTRIIKSGENYGPATKPRGILFDMIKYKSNVGQMSAYITKKPEANKKLPAIVWITGGDCNTIGEIWNPGPRSNDQTASPFRKAGMVMMYPSLRGGNDSPGKREGFYGEVDDVLAATDYLAKLPYVDPQQIYLGGHSTGGTLVMLVAASTDRYKAVFSLGPVATPAHYGNTFLYCDPNNEDEIALRSPIFWLHSVRSPLYVFEGAKDGNWESIDLMVKENKNPKVKFFKVPGHDHFSIIQPLCERLARQMKDDKLNITKNFAIGMR